MTINVKDASGNTVELQTPNANGRAAASSSKPVVLSTEDKASLDSIVTAIQAEAYYLDTQPISATSLPLPSGASTSTKQDAVIAAINALSGVEYETVAASQTDQVLGTTGAIGDLLVQLIIVPTSTSPGAVSIKDGFGTAIPVFAGGASSISTLHPFSVGLNIRSSNGAWKVTTGSNVTVLATGDFT